VCAAHGVDALNLRSNAVMMQLAVGVSLLLTIKSVTCDSTHVAVIVVMNSPTLTDCQGLDLGSTFVIDCRYRLTGICGSLIFARFSAIGMGVGLYTGWFICEYIQ